MRASVRKRARGRTCCPSNVAEMCLAGVQLNWVFRQTDELGALLVLCNGGALSTPSVQIRYHQIRQPTTAMMKMEATSQVVVLDA